MQLELEKKLCKHYLITRTSDHSNMKYQKKCDFYSFHKSLESFTKHDSRIVIFLRFSDFEKFAIANPHILSFSATPPTYYRYDLMPSRGKINDLRDYFFDDKEIIFFTDVDYHKNPSLCPKLNELELFLCDQAASVITKNINDFKLPLKEEDYR